MLPPCSTYQLVSVGLLIAPLKDLPKLSDNILLPYSISAPLQTAAHQIDSVSKLESVRPTHLVMTYQEVCHGVVP
ncbi:hypothetical protein ES703_66903 [subsurface metagenome]